MRDRSPSRAALSRTRGRQSFVVGVFSAFVLIALYPGTALTSEVGGTSGDPGTWRLDFHHTGGLGTEVFALDRIVVEPLAWPGHLAGFVDRADTGDYRYEVVDAAGKVTYSRGFSSIFAEWETTAPARERYRTFHESLRFPEPKRPVTLVVSKRRAGRFEEVWRQAVDPGDIFIDRAPRKTLPVIEIERHGEPRDKLDVLLLGDGYTAAECGEKFPDDARRMNDALLGAEPFRSRRADINVWGLCPPSAESGVSRPSSGVHVASPVGATYDAFGSERYVLTFDNLALREIAASAPYEVLAILVNRETYGGGGIYNLYATVAVDNAWAEYVFVHELGHHIAGLADEYYTSPVAYESPEEVSEPWMPNATALLDPAGLKWREWVRQGTPIPTPWPKEAFEEHSRAIQERRRELRAAGRPEAEMSMLFSEQQAFESKLLSGAEHAAEVGAFQGANYDAQAFYRPQVDCIMFTRNEVPFCAVCRRALERVINLYAPR